METKRLYKDPNNKKLSGVCGGLGKYFGIDPTLIRLGWVLISLFTTGFPGLIAYVIFACVMEYEPVGYQGNGQYNAGYAHNPPYTNYNQTPDNTTQPTEQPHDPNQV